MTVLRRFRKQASFYIVAEAIAQAAGLVSFPIFARIFTQAQYGIISLVDSTLRLVGTFSGLGLRPAAVRLWGEFSEGRRSEGPALLTSTLLSAALILGCAMAAITVLLVAVPGWPIPAAMLGAEARSLIMMAAAVIVFRTVTRMVQSLVQAREKSAVRSAILIADPWLRLAFSLLFVLGLGWGLKGLFGGILLGEGLLFASTVFYALRHLDWRPAMMKLSVASEAVFYGLPLVVNNAAGTITDIGDRYLLELFVPTADLGLYQVGYQLCNYTTFFALALNSALIPVIMNTWSREGPEESIRSLEKYLRYYIIVALPVLFGVTAVGTELISFVGGTKWAPAAAIIPWVLAGKVVQHAYFPFQAGFYFAKKTGTVALFSLLTAALNIALNLLLIPRMQIAGAAIATLISYCFFVFGSGFFARRHLKVCFPWFALLTSTVAALLMFALVRALPQFANDGLTLLLRIPAGIATYLILILALDGDLRRRAASLVASRKEPS